MKRKHCTILGVSLFFSYLATSLLLFRSTMTTHLSFMFHDIGLQKVYNHNFRVDDEVRNVVLLNGVWNTNKKTTKMLKRSLSQNKHFQESRRRFESLEDIHTTIWHQIEILQEHGVCEKKKVLICENIENFAGFGSMMHRYGVCMQIAFGLGRMWFINQREYEVFGGLSTFLQQESTKCGHLKETFINNKDKCVLGERRCYLENGYNVNNTFQVLVYNAKNEFPQPRHLPTTIPLEVKKALAKFNVEKPWLWFTSQILGYYLLRFNANFQIYFETVKSKIGLRHPYIAMHIRRGDKLESGEGKFISASKFLDKALRLYRNTSLAKPIAIYIASDDKSVVSSLQSYLEMLPEKEDYYFLSLPETRPGKGKMIQDILFELQILAHSNYTICTFTSNIGRLVYELKQNIAPYKAQNNVISLDKPHTMFYQWFGFYDEWLDVFWVTTKDNYLQRNVDSYELLQYNRGTLFDYKNVTKVLEENSVNITLAFGFKKFDILGRLDGYVVLKHLKKWPGNPKYFFYP